MTLPHLDDEKYEFEHSDGTYVTVNIDEVRNGGRIGIYWYDEDYEKQSYYSLRINNADERLVTVQRDDEGIPEAVDAALHAGGWRTANTSPGSLDESDPVLVSILDMRDIYQGSQRGESHELAKEWCDVMARVVEESAAALFTFILARSSGISLTDALGEQQQEYLKSAERTRVVGGNIHAAIEESWSSTFNRTLLVGWLEDARMAYRAGEEWREAVKQTRPDEFAVDDDGELFFAGLHNE